MEGKILDSKAKVVIKWVMVAALVVVAEVVVEIRVEEGGAEGGDQKSFWRTMI